MNAAETIQAAIDKLETLKAQSTSGPWKWPEFTDEEESPGDGGWWILNADEHGLQQHAVAVALPYNPFGNADASLIVTLHRTIDAQLVILRWFLGVLNTAPGYEPPPGNEHVSLAEAILGGDS